MSTSVSRRLLGGSVLRMTALITGILVSFYVMPFLIHTLGDRWYGFWALAGSFVGYYTVLDLGLTSAAHRFLAISSARADHKETSRVFVTALTLFTGGGLVALVIMGLTWVGVAWFVSPADLGTIRALVLLLGINFALGFPVAVFNGVLAANLRYDLSSYLHLGKLILRTVLVVAALGRVPSVVMLAWITLGTDLLGNLATAIAATRLWPWLEFSPGLFDRERVSEFFHYGLSSFLIRLGDLVRFGVDNLVVAGFLGVAAVTHYSIAMRLTDYFRDLMVNALGVLMPVFSRLHGLDDRAALFDRVRQASRLAVALSASIAGAAVIFGAPFIGRWMGPQYLDAYWPLVILMCAALIGVMQTPSTNYLFAIAKHRYYAALNGGDAAVNFILSLLLAPRFGMIGVALGTAIPTLVVGLVLQPRYVCSLLGFSVGKYWRELGGVLVGTIGLQLPIAGIVQIIHPASYVTIGGLAVALYGVHAVALYLFVLWPEDQRTLADAVPALSMLTTMRQRVVALVARSSS